MCGTPHRSRRTSTALSRPATSSCPSIDARRVRARAWSSDALLCAVATPRGKPSTKRSSFNADKRGSSGDITELPLRCLSPRLLLPLRDLRARVTLRVHLIFEDPGDAVQAGPLRRGGLIVNGTAIADGTIFLDRPDTLADPGGHVPVLSHDHTLALAVQGSIGPDNGQVGPGVCFVLAQQLPRGPERGLHLRTTARIR